MALCCSVIRLAFDSVRDLYLKIPAYDSQNRAWPYSVWRRQVVRQRQKRAGEAVRVSLWFVLVHSGSGSALSFLTFAVQSALLSAGGYRAIRRGGKAASNRSGEKGSKSAGK